MVSETKEIDPRALGSITSGILLLADFGKVHEAIEWVLGHPVWTHEFPSVRARATELVHAQFPWCPLGEVADWETTADELLADYGPTVSVQKGMEQRDADPVTTLKAAFEGPTP